MERGGECGGLARIGDAVAQERHVALLGNDAVNDVHRR
jgi:hypothetical protein